MKQSEKDKILEVFNLWFGEEQGEKIKQAIEILIENAIETHEEIYHGEEG